ncbi:unnamed protein product [Peniophora sp. CBMAI 1063]|nr:unnamed protein product [Peniophora sp. CBMAI 1063]
MTWIALSSQLATLQNTSLICAGLWFQEFITHLRYDWGLLTRQTKGPRPLKARVALWAYLGCRILCLIQCVCVAIISFPGVSDCHVLIKVLTASGFFAVICASTLLSLRVAAVWSWDRRVVTLLITVTLVTLATSMYLMVKIDASFDPVIQSCALNGSIDDALAPSVAVLAGDCIILALLLIGLRAKWSEARQFKLWQVLWSQGLIYLLVAALFEIPFVALLASNINPLLDAMLVAPEAVILAICATRMFRSLNTRVGGQSEESEMFTNGILHGRVYASWPNEVQLYPIRAGRAERQPELRHATSGSLDLGS